MSDQRQEMNALGQPVGFPVPDWHGAARPPKTPLDGHTCRLEPIDPARHGGDLFAANSVDGDGAIWTYLPYGPFATKADYVAWIEGTCLSDDPQFYAIIDRESGTALGVASYLRVSPAAGSIEVGHINYAPKLQRTIMATEAMYLMMAHVFEDLGYRRYEWKCNDLNDGSKRAALRLGFTFEGVFRQMGVYKGRNRDTAWFSILDHEWPAVKRGFQDWLAVDNFDGGGRQRQGLHELISKARG